MPTHNIHAVLRFTSTLLARTTNGLVSAMLANFMLTNVAEVAEFKGKSTSVDWIGMPTTPVKNQGSCGMCWWEQKRLSRIINYCRNNVLNRQFHRDNSSKKTIPQLFIPTFDNFQSLINCRGIWHCPANRIWRHQSWSATPNDILSVEQIFQ